jgi:hypothetical protein
VARHPSAEWLAQRTVEAFPWGTAPTYLMREMMAPMGGHSRIDSGRWEFATVRSHRGRPGRTPMLRA